MRKICFLVLFSVMLNTYGFCQKNEHLTQTEKITYAFAGSAKIVLAFAGFKENRAYGNWTGVFFSLSAIRDIFHAVRKEDVK